MTFLPKALKICFFYQHSISIWTSWALLTKNWWIHPPSVPLSEHPCTQASKSKFPNTNNLSVNCYLKAFLYKGHNGFMLKIVCLDIKIVQFGEFSSQLTWFLQYKKSMLFKCHNLDFEKQKMSILTKPYIKFLQTFQEKLLQKFMNMYVENCIPWFYVLADKA